jgi:membrane protein
VVSADPGPPSSEQRTERLLGEARDRADEARRQVEETEEVVERATTDGWRNHPLPSAVLRVAAAVTREQASERVGLVAAGAAFWLVLSAFPTAVAAISLFGLVVSPTRVASDLGHLASGAPASLGSLVTEQLRRVAATDHAGLSLGLATSLVLAVWSASAGVYNLDRAIRLAYGLSPQRYMEARGRAFLEALGAVGTLGLSALAVSVVITRSPTAVLVAVGIPALLVGITAGVAALYQFAIGGGVALRALIPGALSSSIGVVSVVAGFSAYVDWSTRYTAVYGAFAGMAIAMVGTYLAVYIILLGAVLNMQLASK